MGGTLSAATLAGANASDARAVQLGKVIRMSERVVKPSQEIKVKELLSEVEKEIRDWPGMLSAETLVDTADPHRFVVVTEVRRA